MARLVLQSGYVQFLRRIPDFVPETGFSPSDETGNTRHMMSLPLRFTPVSRLAPRGD